MRLPRFRFTVGRMMVAVAGAGLIFGAWGACRRYRKLSEDYRGQAYAASMIAQAHLSRIESWEILAAGKGKDPRFHDFTLELIQEQAAMDRRRLEYQKDLKKYEHAARYPWLAVGPDPPEPK